MNTMIVSGVHLDHAWVDLSTEFGSALRDWSRQALALTVEEANRRNVDTLVIAGDLFDRSYALPDTIRYASQILETFYGDVVIVPGRSDWIDGTSLYTTHEWASNISICSSAEYEPCAATPTVWASAWTSPGGSVPRVPETTGPRILLRAGMSGSDGRVLAVPDLVHDPREPGGFALVLDTADPSGTPERIEMAGQPGVLVDIEVTDVLRTEDLALAVESALTVGPLVLRLVGTLAPAILLPGFGGPELPAGVVLDIDSLSYATTSVDESDRSAKAEFLRAMAYANTAEPHRHQTTALGLAALDASAQGD